MDYLLSRENTSTNSSNQLGARSILINWISTANLFIQIYLDETRY
jgi:hypothetical protein